MNYEAIYYLKDIDRLNDTELSQLLFLFKKENDILLFAIIEENLKYESEETSRYLCSLKYYVGDKWIFPHLKPSFLEFKKILWYRTDAIRSIQKAVSLDHLFRSVVLENGDSIENAKYVFYVIETIDSQVLCIAVKSIEDFNTCILPAITKFDQSIQILNQI
ncbi:hypothetical protein [Paenibacillus wenxiniae]|uniref:Uncharacterized protein n=1 Tax=Paenibacillus wenxiniae TaxID=1636843 RepID=A0ABW4RCK8_9BACL